MFNIFGRNNEGTNIFKLIEIDLIPIIGTF